MANITLVATGGSRAPTQLELMRRFVEDGHRVRLVCSRNALHFLTSHLLRRPWKAPAFLRRFRPALLETLAYYRENFSRVPHVMEGKWADVLVMAPATCNSVGKLVAGLTDNYPLQVIRAVPRTKKVLVVPSMNSEMWYDPHFQRNVDLLNATDKYRVLCPSRGQMQTGDWGFGAQVPVERIIQETYRTLGILDPAVEAVFEGGAGGSVPWEEAAADGRAAAVGDEARVVLVDEDVRRRQELARAVEREQATARVHQFDTATAALEWLKDHEPALVFTELSFSRGASGFDLIESLRRPGAGGVPVIATSARDRREVGAERLARQEVLYLPKPWNLPFAVGMVSGCLLGRRRRTAMTSHRLAAGELLFREGEEGREVFVVRSGKLRIVKAAGGEEVELGTVSERGIVGEMAFLGQSRRAATVQAVEESELVELDLDDLSSYLDGQPAWLRALIDSLVQHLRATGERIAAPRVLGLAAAGGPPDRAEAAEALEATGQRPAASPVSPRRSRPGRVVTRRADRRGPAGADSRP